MKRILKVLALTCAMAIGAAMADGCIPGPGCGATEQPVIIIVD